jgi:polysaccharide pyruvyl transferase WcaK-like protein
MHACIAAISQEIPTVGIAYSRKFHGVFESVGVADMVVDGRSVDTDEAVDRVLRCFMNRSEMKTNLRENIGPAKNLIMSTFKDILTV